MGLHWFDNMPAAYMVFIALGYILSVLVLLEILIIMRTIKEEQAKIEKVLANLIAEYSRN